MPENKKSIVFHIGSGKTGSTAIQSSLYRSKSENDEHLFYPALRGSNGSQIFRFAFCELNKTTLNVKLKFDGKKEEYNKFQENIKRDFKKQCLDKEHVIISSEFLFESSQKEVESISKYVRNLGFEDIHIIAYIRNPASYYLSVAQQALKSRSTLPTPSSFKYNMSQALENWKSINPNTLVVTEFASQKLYDKDIVKDFEKQLKKNNFDITMLKPPQENTSHPAEMTICLQKFYFEIDSLNLNSKEKLEYIVLARKFANTFNSHGTKPVMHHHIEELVYGRFADEMKLMHQKYGIFSELIGKFDEDALIAKEPIAFKYYENIIENFDSELVNHIYKELENYISINKAS